METYQIKQLLTLIGIRKKKIEELEKEVKDLEGRLEKKDYLEAIVPVLGSNGWTFTGSTLERI